jgi:hypothetical protein
MGEILGRYRTGGATVEEKPEAVEAQTEVEASL